MKRLILAMAVVLAAAPAGAVTFEEGLELKKQEKFAEAETVFAQIVKDNPRNAAALEQWATLLGWLGRFDDSIGAWRRALAARPDDPDCTLGLARVQYWKGELQPARERVEGLLKVAPKNVDALVLAGDISAAQHDVAGARTDYQRAEEIAPSADIELKLSRAAAPLTWRFDSGGQVDSYDTSRGTEGSFFVQGSWQALDSLVLSGGYEQLHQFGATDHRLNFGAYLHPIDALLLTGKVAISPTADTIAPWEASGGAELHLVGPLTATTNVRHLDFSNQGVTIFGGGVRLDLGRFSIKGEGGVVYNTVNTLQGYGAGRVEYGITDAWHVYVGYARGGQAQLLLAPATATDVTAGVTWQIDRGWGIRVDYTNETYGDAYVRNSLGSALTFKF